MCHGSVTHESRTSHGGVTEVSRRCSRVVVEVSATHQTVAEINLYDFLSDDHLNLTKCLFHLVILNLLSLVEWSISLTQRLHIICVH